MAAKKGPECKCKNDQETIIFRFTEMKSDIPDSKFNQYRNSDESDWKIKWKNEWD